MGWRGDFRNFRISLFFARGGTHVQRPCFKTAICENLESLESDRKRFLATLRICRGGSPSPHENGGNLKRNDT